MWKIFSIGIIDNQILTDRITKKKQKIVKKKPEQQQHHTKHLYFECITFAFNCLDYYLKTMTIDYINEYH